MVFARDLVLNHEPIEGRTREVYVARRVKGQQVDPINQLLHVAGGWQSTIAVVTAAAGTYSLTIEGEVVSVTVGVETKERIRDLLMAAVNQIDRLRRLRVSAVAPAAGTNPSFKLVRSKTFTVTATGPAAPDLTASAVASVAGSATKGAVSLTLTEPLKSDIYAGQYLCFADDDDIERIVKVTARSLMGSSTLTVAGLKQAIVGGARAEFPCYLSDRTGQDIERTYNNQQTTTNNTGKSRDGVPTTAEKSISLPGILYYKNAAYLTAKLAADEGSYIHCRVMTPPVDESGDFDWFVEIEGRGLVTSAPSAGPHDGNRTADLTIDFMGGGVVEGDPFS